MATKNQNQIRNTKRTRKNITSGVDHETDTRVVMKEYIADEVNPDQIVQNVIITGNLIEITNQKIRLRLKMRNENLAQISLYTKRECNFWNSPKTCDSNQASNPS